MTLFDTSLMHAAVEFASSELEAFKRDYNVRPVPRTQDLRAGSIPWLALAIPLAFESDWFDPLRRWLFELRADSDDKYWWFHWYRVPAFWCALTVWDEDPSWVDEVIANIDHHKSEFRGYVLECLAFVAPVLSFDDENLRERVESVLKQRYFHADSAVALLLATKGSAASKATWAEGWKDAVVGSFGREQLDAAIEGAPVLNPLFEGLLEIERYAVAGLLGHVATRSKTPVSTDSGYDRAFAHLIRATLERHPLMNPTFRIAE